MIAPFIIFQAKHLRRLHGLPDHADLHTGLAPCRPQPPPHLLQGMPVQISASMINDSAIYNFQTKHTCHPCDLPDYADLHSGLAPCHPQPPPLKGYRYKYRTPWLMIALFINFQAKHPRRPRDLPDHVNLHAGLAAGRPQSPTHLFQGMPVQAPGLLPQDTLHPPRPGVSQSTKSHIFCHAKGSRRINEKNSQSFIFLRLSLLG